MSLDLERVRDRLERIRQVLVAQMEAWLALMPEQVRTAPFVGIAGGEVLCPEDMVAEVRNGTEWGERFLDNAIALMAVKDLASAIPLAVAGDDGQVVDARDDVASSSARVAVPRRSRAASQ